MPRQPTKRNYFAHEFDLHIDVNGQVFVSMQSDDDNGYLKTRYYTVDQTEDSWKPVPDDMVLNFRQDHWQMHIQYGLATEISSTLSPVIQRFNEYENRAQYELNQR